MIRQSLLSVCALVSLGACQANGTYDPGRRMAADQQALAELIGPRTAQPMERCIRSTSSMDTRVIGNTIVARAGDRTYVNHPKGDCSEASIPGSYMVIDPRPDGLYCSGTIVRVVANGGMQVGSCVMDDWTPYR